MPIDPVVDVQGASESVLITQWRNSPRFKALLSGIVQVLQDKIIDPFLIMERALNPDVSSGVILDLIGERLALPRSYISSEDASYFGFEGTATAGGRTFNQAPFFTLKRGVEAVEPIGDSTYRALLKARARRLRGRGANRETLEAVLTVLFGNGYVSESGADIELHTSTTELLIFQLASTKLFDVLFPKPAGRSMELINDG